MRVAAASARSRCMPTSVCVCVQARRCARARACTPLATDWLVVSGASSPASSPLGCATATAAALLKAAKAAREISSVDVCRARERGLVCRRRRLAGARERTRTGIARKAAQQVCVLRRRFAGRQFNLRGSSCVRACARQTSERASAKQLRRASYVRARTRQNLATICESFAWKPERARPATCATITRESARAHKAIELNNPSSESVSASARPPDSNDPSTCRRPPFVCCANTQPDRARAREPQRAAICVRCLAIYIATGCHCTRRRARRRKQRYATCARSLARADPAARHLTLVRLVRARVCAFVCTSSQ